MRGENARLGVETTTRSDHIARSATKPRSSSSTDQRHSARPDRSWLEKAQHSGPRIGSSSSWLEKAQHSGPRIGSSSQATAKKRLTTVKPKRAEAKKVERKKVRAKRS